VRVSPYSAVIIAKNESRTIAKCISALSKVTDDIIVVVDDKSTDDTLEIAKSMGAKVFEKKWGGFSENKNFGANVAQRDWILCFDADEIIDEVIISHLNQMNPQTDTIYLMNRLTYIGEKPVKHGGWYPDWNIRLYNKTLMYWNDKKVHESLIKKNTTTDLETQHILGVVHHFSFVDWKHMDKKYEYYAKMRGKEWQRVGQKPFVIKRWLGPGFRFFKTYIIHLGFLDGLTGYLLAKKEYQLKRKEWLYYDKKVKS
jgi:glycosyltransferase involved in cell wall biosynthesis